MAYDNNRVDAGTPQVSGEVPSGSQDSAGQEPHPVLAALGAAVQQQNMAVDKAAQTLQHTAMYATGTPTAPQMPVQKPSILANASVNNVANEHPTTREGARNKAIGQIAGQAGALVGAYFKKRDAEKTQALAIDLHKSMELQAGMDEAKAVLASDPDNAMAKATLQKNQTLMTSLLNGKNGKEIAKAYDVTFGPEASKQSPDDKKDSMHHQAMAGAMKQYQQDQTQKAQMQSNQKPNLPAPSMPNVRPQTRAEQFEAQVPARIANNPAYQAAMAQYNETVKQAQAAQKNYQQFAGKVMKDEGDTARNAATNQSRESVADINAKGKLVEQQQKFLDDWQMDSKKFPEVMAEIDERGKWMLAASKERTATASQDKRAMLIFTQSSDDMRTLQGKADELASKIDGMKQKGQTTDNNPDLAKSEAQLAATNKALEQSKDNKNTAVGLMYGDPDAAAAASLVGSAPPSVKVP